MKKCLVVLCFSSCDHLAPIQQFLATPDISPMASDAIQWCDYGSLENVLTGILHATGLCSNYPLPVNWSNQIQPSFDAAMCLYLDTFLGAKDQRQFVQAKSNAFFVDAWRSLCKRLGIMVRFIYVRDFSKLFNPATGTPISITDFNVALAMARQAGTDIACFDVQDWENCEEIANNAFISCFTAKVNDSKLPVSRLGDILRASPSPLRKDIPDEIEALHHLYAGKHYGMPLIFPMNLQSLEIVESSARPNSALCMWLKMAKTTNNPFENLDTRNCTVPVNYEERNDDFQIALKTSLLPIRKRMQELRLKVLEYEAITKKHPRQVVPPKNTQANKKIPSHTKAESMGDEKFPEIIKKNNIKRNRFFRLWRKFKSDPAQYFADSRHSTLRRLGVILYRQ